MIAFDINSADEITGNLVDDYDKLVRGKLTLDRLLISNLTLDYIEYGIRKLL
tara:strand:+ start:18328 stop:18483 length:156 start_codon:yes stop_codon:yes gene_type:complete